MPKNHYTISRQSISKSAIVGSTPWQEPTDLYLASQATQQEGNHAWYWKPGQLSRSRAVMDLKRRIYYHLVIRSGYFLTAFWILIPTKKYNFIHDTATMQLPKQGLQKFTINRHANMVVRGKPQGSHSSVKNYRQLRSAESRRISVPSGGVLTWLSNIKRPALNIYSNKPH